MVRVAAGRVADGGGSLESVRFNFGGDWARMGIRVGEGLPVREVDCRVEEDTMDARFPPASLEAVPLDGETLRDRPFSGGGMLGILSWVLLRE